MLIIGLLYVFFTFAIRLYFLIGPIIFLIGAIQLILGMESAITLLLIGGFSVFATIVLGIIIPLSLPKNPNVAINLTKGYLYFFIVIIILSIIFLKNTLILGSIFSVLGFIASVISIYIFCSKDKND